MRVAESANKNLFDSNESLLVTTLCIKILTLLSLYKPTISIVTESYFQGFVSKIFTDVL